MDGIPQHAHTISVTNPTILEKTVQLQKTQPVGHPQRIACESIPPHRVGDAVVACSLRMRKVRGSIPRRSSIVQLFGVRKTQGTREALASHNARAQQRKRQPGRLRSSNSSVAATKHIQRLSYSFLAFYSFQVATFVLGVLGHLQRTFTSCQVQTWPVLLYYRRQELLL